MTVMGTEFNLRDYDITVEEIHRNLPASSLYEHAIRYEKDANIAENGALVAYTGAKTARKYGPRRRPFERRRGIAVPRSE
jgi:phosphoenolpyruvate carboxykinase (ATP)